MTTPSRNLEVILDFFLALHSNNLFVLSFNCIFFLHTQVPLKVMGRNELTQVKCLE